MREVKHFYEILVEVDLLAAPITHASMVEPYALIHRWCRRTGKAKWNALEHVKSIGIEQGCDRIKLGACARQSRRYLVVVDVQSLKKVFRFRLKSSEHLSPTSNGIA